MFQRRGNHVLLGATIKGKNMLPIFCPLKVAPVSMIRIDNNIYKALNLETTKIKVRQYVSLSESPNFDAANIK